MGDADDKMRLYGSADETNRQPRPKQGLRGESTSRGSKPAQRRKGRSIKVEEESGIAFAESGGAGTTKKTREKRPTITVPSRAGLFTVGALAALGAVAGAWWARRMRSEEDGSSRPAAFRHEQTPPENFDQTRDAGPEHIRNESVGGRWDPVDEASDESFPASDPPATY